MRQPVQWIVTAGLSGGVLAAPGCSSLPPLDNPVLVRPGTEEAEVENPLNVPGPPGSGPTGVPTPEGYALVYERVLTAVNDDFDVIPGPRYSGLIQTRPRIAAGYEQPWRGGTPDPRERLIATLQTIRNYAVVRIAPGERGGYRITVEVYKELEDLPQPSLARNGFASFREGPTVDRRVEAVIAASTAFRQWSPQGRDFAFEQKLLRKIQIAVCR